MCDPDEYDSVRDMTTEILSTFADANPDARVDTFDFSWDEEVDRYQFKIEATTTMG